MKGFFKILNNNQNGITLIALVVTIVVLLILAGISVGALTGQNSIIAETSKARSETELLKEREQIEIALINSQDKKNKIDYNKLKDNLEKVFKDKVTVKMVDDEYVISIDGLSMYHADTYGNIIDPGTVNTFVEESNKDTSKDVVFYGYKLLDSEIGLAIYFKMPEEKIKSGNEKIQFLFNSETTTVDINEENIFNERVNGEDYYCVKFRCASGEMTYQIQFSSYDGDTKDSGDYTCSIKDCANEILAKEIDSKTERFIKSLLNLGGKSQLAFNFKTDDLANSGISFDDSYVTADYLKQYERTENGNIDSIKYQFTLAYNSKIDTNIYVQGIEQENLSNYKLYIDGVGQDLTWYKEGEPFAKSSITQEIEDYSKMKSFVVKDLNGNIVSNEIHYCVYSYCYNKISKGESATSNLCKATVAYVEAYKDLKNL